ncbi:reverse transcriptase domain-containing protein [Tanacetum coccineum]
MPQGLLSIAGNRLEGGVSTNGLSACPDKADTVLSLPSLRCIKDVQKLNGKLASLNRFLSKSAKKLLPFFKTLTKCTNKSNFQWTQEAEAAFKQMKKLIAELPTLTTPKEHEELIIYLAAAKEAISVVLMTDREGKQIPVYFVSRVLRGPEVNYTPMEKLVLALLGASKWLKRYFQAYTISMHGRSWSRYLILTNPEGAEFTYAMRFRFEATNNEAEYEALIVGLRIAEQMGLKNLQAHVDSRLVANQIPRSENKKADALSKIASTSFAHLSKQVLVEELKEKSINEKEILDVVEEEGNTWMTPICEYLAKESSEDKRRHSLAPIWPTRGNYIRTMESISVITLSSRLVWRKLCIRQCFASVKHPQANGLVERSNRSLGEGIKARLDERSKDWIEELPHVLWAHRTMIKSSNGETPFSLTYGTEAVIQAEIGMPTLRTAEMDPTKNNEALGINLDPSLDKAREPSSSNTKSKKQEKDGKLLQLKSPRHKFQARRHGLPQQ